MFTLGVAALAWTAGLLSLTPLTVPGDLWNYRPLSAEERSETHFRLARMQQGCGLPNWACLNYQLASRLSPESPYARRAAQAIEVLRLTDPQLTSYVSESEIDWDNRFRGIRRDLPYNTPEEWLNAPLFREVPGKVHPAADEKQAEALFRLGKFFERLNEAPMASFNYLLVTQLYPTSHYRDKATRGLEQVSALSAAHNILHDPMGGFRGNWPARYDIWGWFPDWDPDWESTSWLFGHPPVKTPIFACRGL